MHTRIKKFSRLKSLLLLSAVLLLAPGLVWGQSYFGGIVGTVTDPSGAAIPNAAVTVTNTKTGIAQNTKSNQYGYYAVHALIPGDYSVKVSSSGFQSTTVEPVTIQVARTVTVNAALKVGTVATTVTVGAAAPLLDTANATIGTVVNNTTVVEMPLNGRNFTQLLELVPGSVPTGNTFMAAGGSNYAIGGTQAMSNQFTLDGVYDNEEFFNQFSVQPVIDSIQEFKAQSDISSAKFGRSSGANIAVASKSGTNQFHGDAWEFVRNDAFDANEWFNNYHGSPKPGYRQNQFGFTAGGPVYIPHVWDGKDKAFWFGDYEGLRFNEGQVNAATIPTHQMLGGDFSSFLTGAQATNSTTGQPLFDALGRPVMEGEIYNPYTTRPVTAGQVDPVSGLIAQSSGYVRDQFPGNMIPAGMINPAIARFAQIWYPSVSQGGVNNFINTEPFQTNQYQYNTRFDYNFSSNVRFFGRFTNQHAYQPSPNSLPDDFTYNYNTLTNTMASLTWVANPSTVIDFKSAFSRSNLLNYNTNKAPGVGNFLDQFPIQGTPIKSIDWPMFPEFNISGYDSPGQNGNPFITNVWQQLLDGTTVKGRSTLEYGMSFEHMNSYYDGLFTSQFNFDSVPTSDPQNVSAAGNAVATYLLGLPSSGLRNVGNTAAYMHQNTEGVYFQDNFRATSKLTINAGLRWEYDQWPFEKDDKLGNYYIATHNFGWSGYNPILNEGPNAPRSLMDARWNNFMPRVGIAYALTPNTVIRSSWGIYYNADYAWQGQGARGQWPYGVSDTFDSTNSIQPNKPLMTFFGNFNNPQPGTPPNESHIIARDNHTPESWQWSFSVQRQLTQSLMAEVDYMGSRGKNLPDFVNANDPPPGNPNPVGSDLNPRPEVIYAPTLGAMSNNVNLASSNYNALVLKVNKNFSHGLNFLANYTWSHLLQTPGGEGYGNSTSPQDPNCRMCDYGVSGNSYPSIFTAAWTYDLPAGHGRRFLSNANGVVNAVLGGWELSGIAHYHSGYYYGIGLNFDAANVGARGNVDRPNYVGGVACISNPNQPDATEGFINPAAFAVPVLAFGNLGRNTCVGPSFYNIDLGLYKNFEIREGKEHFQFRSEFFNLPNTHSFSGIRSTLGNPGFGQATGTQQDARIIQFGLKFYW
ncbi:MAG TPA: TonB-dependent receptor [Terriglobia bacterium]|nr:TonB-dependent receptor [Terriglobia bacterium]